ncbi:MAG: hypothetical protein KDA84_24880, partial [Planctomycetaceae bacterium]|nr:hypothetical protein [Planctomycetaceae bacterium]
MFAHPRSRLRDWFVRPTHKTAKRGRTGFAFPVAAEVLEEICLLSVGTPLPQKTGEVFVVDDWDNKITPNDLGFNYFAGNTGATETNAGITTLDVSPVSNGSTGGSLQIAVDFSGQPSEAFAGYFASLWGLTDTLVSLDGTGVQPSMTTPLPGYFLDTQNLFGDFQPLANRSLETLKFDLRLESTQDVTIKFELQDESGFDVFTRQTVSNTGSAWQTVTLALPSSFDNSVQGSGDPSGFDWREVSNFSVVIERNNVGAGISNPDQIELLLDNLVLVDNDGQYPDPSQAADPMSGQLDPQFEEAFLDQIRAASSLYFLDWASTDPRTGGIIQDRSTFADLMTVGGVGFQLSSYVIDAERGYLTREQAAQRVHDVLAVLGDQSAQGPGRVGTIGHEGFFYHFLGVDGRRKQNFDFVDTPEINESLNTVELSTIDTALAIAGVVTVGQFFDGDGALEQQIRNLSNQIYGNVNWGFMLDDARFTNTQQFFLGWKPNETRDDSGSFGRFLLDDDPTTPEGQYSSKDVNGVETPATLDFYTDEGLLIALLAMGSPNPDHRLGRGVWDAMIREDEGGSFIKTFPGALFTYQFGSVWLDTQVLGTDNHPTRPVNFFQNTGDAI